MRKSLKFYMPRHGSVSVMQILEKNVRYDKVEMGGEQGSINILPEKEVVFLYCAAT